MVLGLGHDVVDIAAFRQQLDEPHSTFIQLFSTRERRQAEQRALKKHDDLAVHLAGKWAAKESFIKAWCAALDRTAVPYPFTLDNMPWSEIEILANSHGVPEVVCSGEAQQQFVQTIGELSDAAYISVSISHDGNIASAVVILE